MRPPRRAPTPGADRPVHSEIAYSSNYEFDTPELTTKWWEEVAADYTALHPNATIEWVPIPGNYVDITTKLSLLFRSPTPLRTLRRSRTNSFRPTPNLATSCHSMTTSRKTSWWSEIPKSVQDEDSHGGNVYAVSHGENTNALWFRTGHLPEGWDSGAVAADELAGHHRCRAEDQGIRPRCLAALAQCG